MAIGGGISFDAFRKMNHLAQVYALLNLFVTISSNVVAATATEQIDCCYYFADLGYRFPKTATLCHYYFIAVSSRPIIVAVDQLRHKLHLYLLAQHLKNFPYSLRESNVNCYLYFV